MSWVPRLDPTGGALGYRSRYVPRGTEPVTTTPKPAPQPAVPVVDRDVKPEKAPVVEPAPAVAPLPAVEPRQVHTVAPEPVVQIPTQPPPRPSARLRARLLPETVRGRIVIAAALCASGAPDIEITTADLIVRAWATFPEVFGLRGYASLHPDSNRVLAKLSGHDGLIEAGFLGRGAEIGLVTLTALGATWWRLVGARWLAEQKEAR